MKKLIAILFLILSVGVLRSQTIVTDRPDQTESPISVSPGVIQVESGLLFQRAEFPGRFTIHRSVYPTSLFRLGVFKNFELRLVNEVSTYKIERTRRSDSSFIAENKYSGSEDIQLGFKYQFNSAENKVVLGLVAHLFIPTGSQELTVNDYGVMTRLNIAYDLDEKRSLGANLGYFNSDLDWANEGQERQLGAFTYTLSYGQAIDDRLGVYLEAFGEYVEFEEWLNNMDAGMTYLLRDNIQLDYSFGWGINYIMNYHSIGISFYLPSK